MLSTKPIKWISWNSIGSSYNSIIEACTAFILNPDCTCNAEGVNEGFCGGFMLIKRGSVRGSAVGL